jgi:Pvc16 N-terminal domain
MSEYTVIDDISSTLLNLLRANTSALISSDHITSGSPADVQEDTSPRLSLFLYHIGENKYLKNQDMQAGTPGKLRYPALPLNLFYLLTAYGQTRETEQQIIGRAMQIFYDHAVIGGSLLQGSLAGTYEEIIVAFNPLTIDDMNKLWSMFGSKPYRLSVTYQVSTALIDATRERTEDRVIQRTVVYNVPQ